MLIAEAIQYGSCRDAPKKGSVSNRVTVLEKVNISILVNRSRSRSKIKSLQNRVEDNEGKKQDSFNKYETNADSKGMTPTVPGSSTVEEIVV